MKCNLFAALLLLEGCGAGSVGNGAEQRAAARLAERLGNPEYLQVRNVRVLGSDDQEKICGTVSYNRAGTPSQGAERFAIMPGIVAIEGQPTVTFTFEYFYEQAGCAT